MLLVWKRGIDLNWSSLSPLFMAALGVFLFTAFYYRRPQKDRSSLAWLALFGAFFIWWLGVYPERMVFAEPHLFTVPLHLLYLVIILGAATHLRDNLNRGISIEITAAIFLVLLVCGLYLLSAQFRAESTVEHRGVLRHLQGNQVKETIPPRAQQMPSPVKKNKLAVAGVNLQTGVPGSIPWAWP
ncbi:MAG: hypothetical protein R6V10_08035 [bacterium]